MSKRRLRLSQRRFRRVMLVVISLVIGLYFILAGLPELIDKRFNPVTNAPPYPVADAVHQVHNSLLIVDLHADSLLWRRDLSQRHQQGHLDLPRLQESNVALQIFTVVTQVPSNLQLEDNDSGSDDIFKLALVQRWPLSTWNSLLERSLYQAQQLSHLAQFQKQFRLLLTQSDLQTFVQDRQQNPQLTAGILGLEGAHALEGRLENVERLDQAGFRMLGLAHFLDTEVGGSVHGLRQGGLTDLGRQVVLTAQNRHMLLDLAHSSPQVIDEVVALSTQPVVVSHTGVKGTCNNVRNLSDQQIKAVASTGGVIGIGFWPTAVCGNSAADIAHAIHYVTNLVGVEHVSLGSDFDGAVTAPFDVTGLPLLTAALQAEGYTLQDISKIMGRNILRVLETVLPA